MGAQSLKMLLVIVDALGLRGSELLTYLVLELVSNQNTVGLQRFVPFKVDGVKSSPVDSEKLRSIGHCRHTKQA